MDKRKAYRTVQKFVKKNNIKTNNIRVERISFLDEDGSGTECVISLDIGSVGYGRGATFDKAIEDILENKKIAEKKIEDANWRIRAEKESIRRIEKITGKKIDQIG